MILFVAWLAERGYAMFHVQVIDCKERALNAVLETMRFQQGQRADQKNHKHTLYCKSLKWQEQNYCNYYKCLLLE